MPTEAKVMLVFGIIIILFGVVYTVIGLKNVKQHIAHDFDGHMIEIMTGFCFVKLVVDDKVIDEVRSLQMHTAKLQGKVEEKQIIVNIGSGFLKPKIMTYIDECKIDELSNC